MFQYVFDVIQDEDTILISLEQHDIQPGRQHFGRTLNTIGYRVMKVYYIYIIYVYCQKICNCLYEP
jgi:hypothetical protein